MDTHILYRFFDAEGQLLYVGITSNPMTRFKAHQRGKTWFSTVARSTMEHFASREELAAAEIKAIQTESPLHNISYTDRLPNEPVRLRANHASIARSMTDGSTFPKPDAIADDEPPQLAREHYPCLECRRFTVVREVDDDGIPTTEIVRCIRCKAQWPDEEWVLAVIDLMEKRG